MGVDLPERTFEFACQIVLRCRERDRLGGVASVLSNQLLRSGTSMGSNVEEAQGAQSRADMRAKYSISRKEARESNYWLRLLAATGLVSAEQLAPLAEESRELIAILTTITRKLEQSADRAS